MHNKQVTTDQDFIASQVSNKIPSGKAKVIIFGQITTLLRLAETEYLYCAWHFRLELLAPHIPRVTMHKPNL